MAKLFPNFSEAYMFDGDLVDVKIQDVHNTWAVVLAVAQPLALCVWVFGLEAVANGVQVGLSAMRIGTSPVEVAEGKDFAPGLLRRLLSRRATVIKHSRPVLLLPRRTPGGRIRGAR